MFLCLLGDSKDFFVANNIAEDKPIPAFLNAIGLQSPIPSGPNQISLKDKTDVGRPVSMQNFKFMVHTVYWF